MPVRSSRSLVAAIALAAAAMGSAPTPGLSQAAAPIWPSARFASDSAVQMGMTASFGPVGTTGSADSLPCPDCHPPKRFWAGAGELMIVQAIPWAFNRYVRDAEFARIGPESWKTNLKYAWQWDNNMFANNQFAHPYHGSLYYNTGRTNGYSFWQSVPWAFGGSLMWELFGEVWAPSPNDLLNTSLGGITLGEMLFRFSSLTLDNRATGGNRAVREIGATLINPVRGFNRLVRGEMNDISENPADWRPTKIQAVMDVGYRRFSSSASLSASDAQNQAFLQFSVFYGDQVTDLGKAPFSSFQMVGALATVSENESRGRITDLRVRGNLAARPVGSGDQTQLAGFMTYEYISNPVIDFGGQGFQAGILSRTAPSKPWVFYGEAMARAMPIAAIRSDYFVTAEGRDYDYGVALGGRLEGRALWRGKATLRLGGGYIWLPVISGFSGNHNPFTVNTDVRGYLWRKIGVGASYTQLWRRSRYTYNPDVDRNSSEGRLFLSLATPRWEQ